ncbi:hypothetical protein FNT36_03230 [Hymenobacter setariae]|uniref:Uncharacterized protein n=1 Tax=Hymenobacter setariae TaxID=2594794 RepID=A0A558C2W6_9BACT|nr:hypothetical protein [Hymenobacter setariae]TVT43119.1 hypothetical protein FNT36_03230 [Hymenobacter setariae]
MEVNTTPNTARGEVRLTIAGQQHPVRFNLNVMRDWSKLSGRPASEFNLAIIEDHIEAFSSIITCAIRRFVPAYPEYAQDLAVDLLEEMPQAEADAIAEAITEATVTVNPLLASMSKQLAAKMQALTPSTPSENGATSETSLTAS